jgi:hypothetical protein
MTCGAVHRRPARRLRPTRLLKIVLAAGVAFALMYAETWAIEQAPIWSSADVLSPAANANSQASRDESSSLPDTAGPIAVLH